jgi:FkbM family methyltransferase
MIDRNRRSSLRGWLKEAIDRHATEGVLPVQVQFPGRTPEEFTLKLRAHTPDQQSLVECLGNMYPPPSAPIHYVLDGGANIGLFSIAAMSRLPEVDEVLMVEPSPANLPLLRFNTDQFSRVKTIPAALSDREKTEVFSLQETNTSRFSHLTHDDTNGDDEVEVSCKTITGIIPEGWEMEHTWVKLDIEGAEYDVFPELLRSSLRPAAISAELHDYSESGGEEIVDALEKEGYRVFGHDGESGYCRQIIAERR